MPMLDASLVQHVTNLIDAGCHYDLDRLAPCYAPDLTLLIIDPAGETPLQSFDYQRNLAFFAQRRDAGQPPLDTSAEFLYAQVHDGIGYVVVKRRLDLGAGPRTIVFSLLLRPAAQDAAMAKHSPAWVVFREHAVVTGQNTHN